MDFGKHVRVFLRVHLGIQSHSNRLFPINDQTKRLLCGVYLYGLIKVATPQKKEMIGITQSTDP